MPPDAVAMVPHAVQPGVVLDEGGLKITAFKVRHEPAKPAYGYRIARRSSAIVLARAKSPIVLARAKKNSEIALAGAKIRRVHGVASLASSTASSSRTHPPKRVQGRLATGGSTARNAI